MWPFSSAVEFNFPIGNYCDFYANWQHKLKTYIKSQQNTRKLIQNTKKTHTQCTNRPSCYLRQVFVSPVRQVRSASECVGRRRHCRCDRRTHSDAERTCRAVRPTQFTPPDTTRTGPSCELGITF